MMHHTDSRNIKLVILVLMKILSPTRVEGVTLYLKFSTSDWQSPEEACRARGNSCDLLAKHNCHVKRI